MKVNFTLYWGWTFKSSFAPFSPDSASEKEAAAEDPIAGVIETVMEATPASELKRLRENLLSHYDKTQRPGKESATDVLIYFDARHLISLVSEPLLSFKPLTTKSSQNLSTVAYRGLLTN
ncbi:hypothetical protein AVEN_120773-1 [Araneus ventricosus]|uniref:Uncharacterized protein n=1 Tax=Araneus ventricosus TaxID=182803 RepID=A0A4Y2QWX0_ARAVE|nr:hypothetical protein AVEN_120773-1 [Araneus ventricosus]